MMDFHQMRACPPGVAAQRVLRREQIESAEHDDAAQRDERHGVLAEIEKRCGGPRRNAKGGNAFHAVLL
jgi:glutaredoxin